MILRGTAARLRRLWKEGRIDVFHLRTLGDNLTEITTVQGAYELEHAHPLRLHGLDAPHRGDLLLRPSVRTDHDCWPRHSLRGADDLLRLRIDAVGRRSRTPSASTPTTYRFAISTMIEINLREHLGLEDAPTRRSPEKHLC